jgi:RNA polymerase sigma-70 factor (ECF subfamily)
MRTTDLPQGATEASAAVAAATAGDEAAFGALAERYRPELQVHCYRMLGSLEDSEDLVQETFLRAWRRRATYAGRSTFRAWLYRIATNACLDHLERHPRRPPTRTAGPPVPAGAVPEVPWLQPYPDRLLEGLPGEEPEPAAAVVARETIELAFLATIQHLTPAQRAVLILRDVLGWSARDTAALLDGSVASVNSSLQRARATLKEHLPVRRLDWGPAEDPSEDERELLRRYVDAHERADADAVIELLRADARITMPPEASVEGRDALIAFFAHDIFGPDGPGEFRLVATRANRMPAAANYLRRPGDDRFRAVALDVLRIEDGVIVEINVFDPRVFPRFGLPDELEAP